jgi:hypothetical protein
VPEGARSGGDAVAETGAGPLATATHALGTSNAPASVPAQSLSQLKIQYGELARQYERAKTEHEALMKKRETTDRQLERERTSAEGRYDIITPPTASKASLLSALAKRAGFGIVVGTTLALLAAVYLELRRILILRGHI